MAQTIQIKGYPNTKTIINLPKVIEPKILDGFWSDPATGSNVTEAEYGKKVKFTVKTKGVKDGNKLDFILFDYDGNYNPDDELNRSFSATVKNNVAELEFTPDIKWEESAKYEVDKVIEVFFEVKISILSISEKLPIKASDYLKIYQKEIKITVIVELPHSSETGWGAKGLAGHTAMAIGEQYFDYGPNNRPGKYSEKDYDVDFNEDGDKDDIVQLNSPSFKDSPECPGGEHI